MGIGVVVEMGEEGSLLLLLLTPLAAVEFVVVDVAHFGMLFLVFGLILER